MPISSGDSPPVYRRNNGLKQRSRRPSYRRIFSDAPAKATSEATPAAEPPAPRASSYLPALDGIRALAVIAVMIYHARPDWLPGGFLGVDVFFAVSGYIITRGLLNEWRENGRIGIGAFYVRRARRLLPAVLLLIAAVLSYSLVFQPEEVAGLRMDALAALAYVTNWHFVIGGQSYFELFARPSELRHLWSLAVEEQFYLVWPLVFVFGMRFLRARLLLALVLLLAVSSVAWGAYLYEAGVSTSRLYYGSDTRAACLLIGAALALAGVGARPKAVPAGARWSFRHDLAGVAGIYGVALPIVFLNESSALLYQGGFALVALASAILVISAVNYSMFSSILSLKPLRWIGQRSYGIYLWHWPISLMVWPELPSLGLVLAQIAAAIAIAALSYRLLEEPIRSGKAIGAIRRSVARDAGLLRRGGMALTALGGVAMVAALGLLVATASPKEQPPYLAAGSIRLISESGSPQDQDAEEPAISTPLPEVVETATPEPTPEPPPPPRSEPPTTQVSLPVTEPPAPVATEPPPPVTPIAPPVWPGGAPLVTAVGDSVLLGAANQLASLVPSVDIDAAIGRQTSAAIGLLRERAAQGALGEVIVINVGNNGSFTDSQFDQIMEVAGPSRRVVFVNIKVPRRWEESNNNAIANGVNRYSNAVLVDWHAACDERPDFFYDDAVHLRPEGAWAFANLVATAIRG